MFSLLRITLSPDVPALNKKFNTCWFVTFLAVRSSFFVVHLSTFGACIAQSMGISLLLYSCKYLSPSYPYFIIN